MSSIEDLMVRAEQLAAREKLSLSTVSRKILNDGKGLSRLKAGGQVTVRTLETAFEKLRELERGKDIERKDGMPGMERKFFAAADFGGPAPRPAGGRRDGAGLSPLALSHLDRLEAESIHIMREVAAEASNPALLYSVGKDSAVMVHLALKAFFPSRPPFPIVNIDTNWNFSEMNRFRDQIAKDLGLKLIVHMNEEGLRQGINPFTHGSALHTDIMNLQGLKQALDKYKFDAVFGGGRRDEEKSRAKERIFSFRTAQHRWDPKNQRPELWNIYNAQIHKGESIRVFPLSNWTELDVWQYIYRENIKLPSLYFAAEREVVERDGVLILVDDDRFPFAPGERSQRATVRFRTLGCYPLTGAVPSSATTVPQIIQETLLATKSERQNRVIDGDQPASMERKKQEGYY
jgi:sulfate adenylyltransferase subunit 2